MKTYKYYTALIIAMAMLSCMVFAQAPVRRNTTTNRTTSTPSRKPTQRQTKPPTNATPPKQTASQPKKSQPSGYVNGHMAVDLGLSVRWADCNVGANSPEQFGNLFGWGDPTGQNYTRKEEDYPRGNIAKTQYDMAYVNWGGAWRLPTHAECEELVSKCSWAVIMRNGTRGYQITGPNGSNIFLPSAGYTEGGNGRYWYYGAPPNSACSHPEDFESCYYWGSEEMYSKDACCLSLYFYKNPSGRQYGSPSMPKKYRFSVRAVTE